MYLLINNLFEKKTIVGLYHKNKFYLHRFKKNKEENIIKKIDRLLSQYKIKIEKIKGILVACGPGKFTSIRSALSTVNTIGYLMNIPCLGIKKNDFINRKKLKKSIEKLSKVKHFFLVKPFYGKKPNIT